MNRSFRWMWLVGGLTLLVACQSPKAVTEEPSGLHTLGMQGVERTLKVTLHNDHDKSSTEVTAGVLDGKLVYQGEVLRDLHAEEAGAQSAIVTTRRWTGNTVPYTIAAGTPTTTVNDIQNAVNYYNTNTNVRWVVRTTQRDYVEFFVGSGCWSYVGHVGGRQQISLGSGCGYSAALHEMSHALGIHHEQSRPDRDSYVRIRYDLIPDNIEYNWDKAAEAQPYGAYDYYSIMHYSLYYGGQKVIEVLQSGIDESRIGRGNSLTATDLSAVNYLYPSTTPPPPPSSGTTYTGSFSGSGQSAYHPGSGGFSYTGGALKATLSGPTGPDFDLYLQKLGSTGYWSTVARSESYTSSESITYAATSGTYRWRVYSYNGSGSYTLTTQQ
ncbi:MAG TPA: M12 family metallopeptidase [Meiothermus sp.]|nr:M12 family metallopeptidase [Meiothermus sp.]